MPVISISVDSDNSKDTKLAEIFRSIQQRLDVQEGVRFRASRPEVFEEIPYETFVAASKADDASSILASYSNLCFVMTPYAKEPNLVFHNFIKPVVQKFGLTVLRSSDVFATGSIIEQVRTAIRQSRLCIADISGQNPNVMYELSLAQELKKPIVLLARDKQDVSFYLKSQRLILYNINKFELAKTELESAIEQTLIDDSLVEAKRLIESGMYRAAVATLGVLLEQSLRKLLKEKTESEREGPILKYQSIGKMLNELSDQGTVSPDDRGNLYEATLIRNRAVHELKEPSKAEVQFMFEVVENFMKKYSQ